MSEHTETVLRIDCDECGFTLLTSDGYFLYCDDVEHAAAIMEFQQQTGQWMRLDGKDYCRECRSELEGEEEES